MASRTERRTYSAPNVCWSPDGCRGWTGLRSLSGRVFPAGLLLCTIIGAGSARAEAGTPGNVHDCRPCTFVPGPKEPEYSFTFEVTNSDAGRVLKAIDVRVDLRQIQRLPVSEMTPVGEEEDFFFGGVDLNLDGFLDLMLITRHGVANAYADYWLFDPATGTYQRLGNYAILRVDPKTKHLRSYERGGMGGLIYESKEYDFVAGKLTLVRDEKQDSTTQAGILKKTIRERINGALKTVKVETVQAPRASSP